MKRKSTLLTFYLIFAICFTTVGIFAAVLCTHNYIKGQKLIKDGVSVQAVITDIEVYTSRDNDGDQSTYHNVFVSYDVDGETFEKEISSYDSSMYKGKHLTLYYMPPDSPYNADYINGSIDIIIGVTFGLLFTAIGVGFLIAFIKLLLRRRLVNSGIPVYADLKYCGYGNIRINNRPTYLVECEWTDETGIPHQYKSNGIKYCPDDIVSSGKVEVFVNPDNYNNYYINL